MQDGRGKLMLIIERKCPVGRKTNECCHILIIETYGNPPIEIGCESHSYFLKERFATVDEATDAWNNMKTCEDCKHHSKERYKNCEIKHTNGLWYTNYFLCDDFVENEPPKGGEAG